MNSENFKVLALLLGTATMLIFCVVFTCYVYCLFYIF